MTNIPAFQAIYNIQTSVLQGPMSTHCMYKTSYLGHHGHASHTCFPPFLTDNKNRKKNLLGTLILTLNLPIILQWFVFPVLCNRGRKTIDLGKSCFSDSRFPRNSMLFSENWVISDEKAVTWCQSHYETLRIARTIKTTCFPMLTCCFERWYKKHVFLPPCLRCFDDNTLELPLFACLALFCFGLFVFFWNIVNNYIRLPMAWFRSCFEDNWPFCIWLQL